LSVQLVSKISNLCDPDPFQQSLQDRQTEGRTFRQTTCNLNTALCTKVHRAVTITLSQSYNCTVISLIAFLKPHSHCACTCTRVHVVIEHVDFYDGTHTDCSHARARTSDVPIELGSICAWCCVNFAATARSITQYHAVSA